jgi:hypothetical protein
MPLTYFGDGTQPTPVTTTRVNIASSTNASPIVVTTAAPHGFSALGGDTVEVEGHLVNTAANGLWQITWVDTTHFSLNGSTGNGVGGATGYVDDYGVSPANTFPLDGEAIDSSSSNPPLENLTNIAPFLYRRVGKYRLYDIYNAINASFTPGGVGTLAVSSTTFAVVPGMTSILGFFGGAHSPIVQAGDVVVVNLSLSVQAYLTAGTPITSLGLGFSAGGGAYAIDGPSQQANLASAALLNDQLFGINLSSYYSPISANTFDVSLMGALAVAGGTYSVIAFSPFLCTAFHYRLN